ncbi:hypothetical protein EF918_29845 [Streptomyces sp. WAC06614]|nr:hypothetical protein EF918_29845 [Streptomyces sp. WAC06614]
MPGVVGQPFKEAQAAVTQVSGVTAVQPRSAYADVTLAADPAQWTVCFQTPAAGAEVPAGTRPELSLTAPGSTCPQQAGATSKPSKAPSKGPGPTPTNAPGPAEPPAGATPGGAPAGVYYKTCADARAAGAAPIRRGQPGYGKHLDRDNDGIACDK